MFEDLLNSTCRIVLLTEANITTLQMMTERVHARGKLAWVNMELLGGFGRDQTGLKLLQNHFHVDGVMSTDSAKLAFLKRHTSLFTVQRFFLTDSRGLETGMNILKNANVDAAEILPACTALGHYERFRSCTNIPLLAGGFVYTKAEAERIKRIGYNGITTSSKALWGTTK